MSTPPNGPEVIRFSGIWGGIPNMHKYFQDADASISFDSSEHGGSRAVHWLHNTEHPLRYIFTSIAPGDIMDGYKIYDLTIDESESFARLHVIKFLGDAVLQDAKPGGELADLGYEAIANGWHEVQHRFGMVLPHTEEKASFERIYKDFVDATSTTKYQLRHN